MVLKYIFSFHAADTQKFKGMSIYFQGYGYLLSRVRVPLFQHTRHRSTVSTGFRSLWHSDCPYLFFFFSKVLLFILNIQSGKILNNVLHQIPHMSSLYFKYCTTKIVVIHQCNHHIFLKQSLKIQLRSS